CVLASWGFWRWSPRLGIVLAIVVTGFSVAPWVVPPDDIATTWQTSETWRVDLPALGRTIVTSGPGLIREYAVPEGPNHADGERWVGAELELDRKLEAAGAEDETVAFGFRHVFLNPNTINMDRLFADKAEIDLVSPPLGEVDDTAAAYQDWLTED